MIGFYIMMIAVLGLAGAVGYTIFSSVQSANALSVAERNSMRMEQVVDALRQVVVLDASGNMFIPAPETIIPEDRPEDLQSVVPDWVSSQAITSWGVDYGYCPYAPVTWASVTGTPATVKDRTGEAYVIKVVDGPQVYGGERPYVSEGARVPHAMDATNTPDVLAFITTASNNGLEAPACEDVYWNGRSWLVTGDAEGSVRAVTVDAMSSSLATAPRILTRHVEPGGTGSGRIDADGERTNLESALAEWRWLGPGRMTIEFEPGTYSLDPAALDLGTGAGSSTPGAASYGRHLVLLAPGGATLNADTPGVLGLPVDTTIDGLQLGDGFDLEVGAGMRLLAAGATTALADVTSLGGEIAFSGIASAGHVELLGGSAHISGATDLSGLHLRGGTAVLSGEIAVTAAVGDTAAPVRVDGGSLTLVGTGAGASVDATQAGTAGIALDGGSFRLEGALAVTTASSQPVFADTGTALKTFASGATVSLNEAGQTLSSYSSLSRLDLGMTLETGDTCNSVTICAVTCPSGTNVVSGSCSAEDSIGISSSGMDANRETFTCIWASAITSATASAICAPLE